MKIKYRKAGAGDVEVLSRLRVDMLSADNGLSEALQSALYQQTKEYLLSGLKGQTFSSYIAEADGVVVAMGGICYFDLPPTEFCLTGKTAYVSNIYTLPAYRKNGIAGKIVKLLMEEAEGSGVERVLLKPTAQGKPLYQEYGFQQWKDAMVYFF